MIKGAFVTTQTERRIPLTGSFHFRDVGGYETRSGATVRWKQLYRSDALGRLTPEDIELLRGVGISTLLDLRSPREVAETGPGLPAVHLGARHHHIPFTEDIAAMSGLEEMSNLGALYAQFLESGQEPVRKLFLALAEGQTYPAVIHCAAGKDRTGVSVALVLRVLGVPDDVIAVDYGMTDDVMSIYVAKLRESGYGPLFDRVHPELLRARPESILHFIGELDRQFGSTEGYLNASGVPSDALETIRAQLLEQS
jgi:protein-tyrosine phosphatase